MLVLVSLYVTSCKQAGHDSQEPVKAEQVRESVAKRNALENEDPEPETDSLYEESSEEEEYLPEILPLPQRVPADIVAHFTQLEAKKDAFPIVRHLFDGEVEHIRKTLGELQRYSTGKRKYYPVEDVEKSMNYLSAFPHHNSGHGGDDYPEIRQANNYQNHFAAIAAMLCPNLDFVTPLKDATGTIGIRQFINWSSSGVIKTYVYLPKGKGLKLTIIDELDEVIVDKIFRLEDRFGRVYYMFSNDDSKESFGQVLCLYNRGKLEHVTTFRGLSKVDVVDEFIQFNPRTLEWYFCYEDADGYLHKIPDAPYVKLELAGKKSSIRVMNL